MNKMKWMVLFMSITIIFSGCASMNNTGKDTYYLPRSYFLG